MIERTSTNTMYEVIETEELSEKTVNKSVENSSSVQETTQSTIPKIDTEKISKDFWL